MQFYKPMSAGWERRRLSVRSAGLMHLVLAALVVTGCQEPPSKWTYNAMPPVDRAPLIPKSVAVPPLADERLMGNEHAIGLSFVPLMPYGWIEYNSPETIDVPLDPGQSKPTKGWQFRPTEDIAKALAQELHHRRLFRKSFFTFRASEGDLILRGTLSSMKREHMRFSYGLGLGGSALWLLGLPVGKNNSDLSLKLRLEDRSSGKILWEKAYATEHNTKVWFYFPRFERPFLYDAMLKELMPTILADLEQALKGQVPPSSSISDLEKLQSQASGK